MREQGQRSLYHFIQENKESENPGKQLTAETLQEIFGSGNYSRKVLGNYPDLSPGYNDIRRGKIVYIKDDGKLGYLWAGANEKYIDMIDIIRGQDVYSRLMNAVEENFRQGEPETNQIDLAIETLISQGLRSIAGAFTMANTDGDERFELYYPKPLIEDFRAWGAQGLSSFVLLHTRHISIVQQMLDLERSINS